MAKPFVTNLTSAERVIAWGDEIVVLANTTDTGGTFCLFQQIYDSSEWAPLHFHEHEDHFVQITQGAMEFELAGVSYNCSAGNGIFMPRQQWHRFRKTSTDPVVMLVFNLPSGLDNMYHEIALTDPGKAGDSSREEILKKYGVHMKAD